MGAQSLVAVVAERSDFVDLLSVIAWPLIALIAILVAVSDRGRRLLRPILRRIRKLGGPGGFALELSEEAAAATKSDVQGAIHEYSLALRDEFERLAHAEDVRNRMVAAVETALAGHRRPDGHDLRATVHIHDALYVDALYQLVDYWPGGGGSGRRLSIRFGIVGRVWRRAESEYEPGSIRTEELMEKWGMTREQAEQQARGRKSFVCVVLRHKGSLVGVMYMDAKVAESFPNDILCRLDDSPLVADLATAVGSVRQQIAKRGPALKLLQSD